MDAFRERNSSKRNAKQQTGMFLSQWNDSSPFSWLSLYRKCMREFSLSMSRNRNGKKQCFTKNSILISSNRNKNAYNLGKWKRGDGFICVSYPTRFLPWCNRCLSSSNLLWNSFKRQCRNSTPCFNGASSYIRNLLTERNSFWSSFGNMSMSSNRQRRSSRNQDRSQGRRRRFRFLPRSFGFEFCFLF